MEIILIFFSVARFARTRKKERLIDLPAVTARRAMHLSCGDGMRERKASRSDQKNRAKGEENADKDKQGGRKGKHETKGGQDRGERAQTDPHKGKLRIPSLCKTSCVLKSIFGSVFPPRSSYIERSFGTT